MNHRRLFLFFLLFFLLFSGFVSSHETGQQHQEGLSSNIQKAVDYNNEQAQFYLRNLSFLVAFLVGIVGILSPCSLAILPSFFAYAFEEKKNLAKMTFIFFLGFAPVFVGLGILAAFLGKTIAGFQQSNSIFVMISGAIIIFFGLMVLFGKGFSGIRITKKTSSSKLGVFLFGSFFAVGFTACVGPVLFGILLIAGVLQSYLYAAFLMLFYSLGLFSSLFFVAFFFDKYNFSKVLNNLNRKVGFSITNLIGGLLIILLGGIFLFYSGTSVITGSLGLGGFTVKIYSLMDKIVSYKFSNLIGGILLTLFLTFLWQTIFSKKNKKDKLKNEKK